MNRYPFHIGDYRKATDHLTDTEDLTYRRLIDFYYDTEMPIPTDLVSVSRRIRCSRGDVEQILNEFFHLAPDGWRHYRCDKELEAIYARSAAAKASIESRWNRQKHTNVLPTNNEGNTNAILPITHYPLPITHTESKPLASSDKSLSAEKTKINGNDPTPVIERIPITGDKEYEVHQSIIMEWERLFPAVDVPQTLREIRAWNLANPKRRKTARGVVTHITAWLAKEQNKPEPQFRR